MSKQHPETFIIALVAAALAALGIVQYLALAGLIDLSVARRIHFIFYPAYSIGGAFGVMFQWFLIAAVFVAVGPQIIKSMRERKREREQREQDALGRDEPAPERPKVVARNATSFGRKGRV